MYEERYDNHFRRLAVSRDVFADFADYTLEALQLSATPRLIREQRPVLQAALDAFRAGLRSRTGGSGQRQSGTQTENQAFKALKQLVQVTDVKLLQPRFLDAPAEEALFYPDKLGGLTQAPKTKRLTRYTAYTELLEQHPDAAVQAAGKATRALLSAYVAATTIKNQGAKHIKDSAGTLGPDANALADALWDVHCAALYEHRQQPAQARAYFAYDRLPVRNAARRRKNKQDAPGV